MIYSTFCTNCGANLSAVGYDIFISFKKSFPVEFCIFSVELFICSFVVSIKHCSFADYYVEEVILDIQEVVLMFGRVVIFGKNVSNGIFF